MFGLLLLVIGCYVLAALSVHLAYRIQQRKLKSSLHYVLVADNQQKNMEWYMRSLFSFSRRMGKDVQVTIVDRGASEETIAIVERLTRGGNKINMHAEPAERTTGKNNGKRSQQAGADATHLMWMLHAEGIVSESDHAVLVDLQNPADLSKMPF